MLELVGCTKRAHSFAFAVLAIKRTSRLTRCTRRSRSSPNVSDDATLTNIYQLQKSAHSSKRLWCLCDSAAATRNRYCRCRVKPNHPKDLFSTFSTSPNTSFSFYSPLLRLLLLILFPFSSVTCSCTTIPPENSAAFSARVAVPRSRRRRRPLLYELSGRSYGRSRNRKLPEAPPP